MPPCGQPKNDGSTCQQPEGWGRDIDEGPCKYHADDGGSGQSGRSDRTSDARVDAEDRPYGELQITKILDALRGGATYKIACKKAGVSPRSFRRWKAKYDDLRERVQRAEADGADELLGVVQGAADSGDWRAAKWLLSRRHGYDKSSGEFSQEDVDLLMETIKGVLRDRLPDGEATDVIAAIGDELEEVEGATI